MEAYNRKTVKHNWSVQIHWLVATISTVSY